MFRHYWPEEGRCDKCGKAHFSGAMLYFGNIPISFVCEGCNPKLRQEAVVFAQHLADDDELNGWDWVSDENPDFPEK
jgi:hypothetical protein